MAWNWLPEWLRRLFVKVADANDDGVLDARDMDIWLGLAKRAAEPLVGVDLSGDGIVSSRDEILSVGKQLGLKKLGRLVEGWGDLPDPEEVKRVLVIARTALAIAARFGLDRLPRFRQLELVVAGAVNLLD